MKITGIDLAKKYGEIQIFSNLNFEVESNDIVAIKGKNGAGKSTLLQIIAGYLIPSKGKILVNNQPLEAHKLTSVFIGPYTEIIEEFTLREFLAFHKQFKKQLISTEEIVRVTSLPLDKSIAEFSTGMKKRIELITAFYFENDLIFMDEPTSNLDQEGFDWWKHAIQEIKNKIIFIASNDKKELNYCIKELSL